MCHYMTYSQINPIAAGPEDSVHYEYDTTATMDALHINASLRIDAPWCIDASLCIDASGTRVNVVSYLDASFTAPPAMTANRVSPMRRPTPAGHRRVDDLGHSGIVCCAHSKRNRAFHVYLVFIIRFESSSPSHSQFNGSIPIAAQSFPCQIF
jgi:hypothetical protein